ncbi:MAG: ATP-dependent RNA helicase DbpA [Mariprofundaceae bacterium]|nr:ATP-dependent RNA helicase DbpA [Mariprofundaceae bacterium]
MSQTNFASLAINDLLIQNLATLHYQSMTPIQSQSLPAILEGNDVIGQAKTGSGKTAAFGLGLLNKLTISDLHVQGLILCPTRELADQVSKDLRKLARTLSNVKILTLAGGLPFKAQASSLAYGAHIVVGTPGRILDHLEREHLDLTQVTTCVLDEADRMLDMGFQEALDSIAKHVPKERQTLLFSATFPEHIQHISQHLMQQPVHIQVNDQHNQDCIEQHFYEINPLDDRIQMLSKILSAYPVESTIVFCNTKRDTKDVSNALIYQGFSALALNGDLEQWERDQAMIRFANQSISILIATDVAARGLDIKDLDLVVNYHIAQSPETHVHRMGRTGRAGKQGIACSIFSQKESFKVTRLGDYLERNIIGESLDVSPKEQKTTRQDRMTTLQIGGGKKQKIRAGDILGALTSEGGIEGKQVGKIHILDQWAYVAVERSVVNQAFKKLNDGLLKGKKFRVRRI